jgi:hypothetical protein
MIETHDSNDEMASHSSTKKNSIKSVFEICESAILSIKLYIIYTFSCLYLLFSDPLSRTPHTVRYSLIQKSHLCW